METCEAREALKKWGNTRRTIDRLEAERRQFALDVAEARRTLKARELSGVPRSKRSTDLSDVAVQIENAQGVYAAQCRRINADIAEAIRVRNAVQDIIIQLSPPEMDVLTLRYREHMPWKTISQKTGYDEASARRLERQAVEFIKGEIL